MSTLDEFAESIYPYEIELTEYHWEMPDTSIFNNMDWGVLHGRYLLDPQRLYKLNQDVYAVSLIVNPHKYQDIFIDVQNNKLYVSVHYSSDAFYRAKVNANFVNYSPCPSLLDQLIPVIKTLNLIY